MYGLQWRSTTKHTKSNTLYRIPVLSVLGSVPETRMAVNLALTNIYHLWSLHQVQFVSRARDVVLYINTDDPSRTSNLKGMCSA